MSRAALRRQTAWVVSLAVLFGASIAGAPRSYADPTLSLSPSAGPPTTTVVLSASGFAPSETVDVSFDSTVIASDAADTAGGVTGSVDVPATATPGAHTVSATGETSGATATAVFVVRTDWQHLGFDLPHSADNPYENVISPANARHLAPRWIGQTGGRINSSPAVADGYVFVGSFDDRLSVFADDCASDGGTCQPVWTGETGGQIFSSPTVADGMVFIGSNDNYLYAFPEFCSTSTCPFIWRFQTGDDVRGSAAVVDGVVYIGSHDGRLYALDEQDGSLLWYAELGTGVRSNPAVYQGLVYVGGLGGVVAAYLAGPGCASPCTPTWQYQTGERIQSSPTVANGLVYVGVYPSGEMYAFPWNCSDPCEPVWVAQTGRDIRGGSAVADGILYTGAGDGQLYAIDALTGQILWTASTGPRTVKSGPGVANGVVYIGSGTGRIYAFLAGPSVARQRSPQFLWSQATAGPVRTSPAIANGTVYVGSVDYQLYAFSVPGTPAGSTPIAP